MKIFGREPALWLALLYSAAVMTSAFILAMFIRTQVVAPVAVDGTPVPPVSLGS